MEVSPSFALLGGLDLSTAPDKLNPGRLISGLNYEGAPRGYRSMNGYERVDGRPSPSEATYYLIPFINGDAEIEVGDDITYAVGSGGGEVIAVVLESGAWADGDAAGKIAYYGTANNVSGIPIGIEVGGVIKAQTDGTIATEGGADTDEQDNAWTQAAMEIARDAIQPVPGEAYTYVFQIRGTKYAIRDVVGRTSAKLYKATTSGWTEITFQRVIDFTSGGTYEIQAGDTITGATSGATAVVRRVSLASGSWAAGTAAGRISIQAILPNGTPVQTGTFVAENLNVGANLNVATVAGNSAAVTLPAGAAYKVKTYNFGGAYGSQLGYGVGGGIGRAFEINPAGSTFAFWDYIYTGMAVDTPLDLEIHKEQLFLVFAGGSLQHSAPLQPHVWNVILGAGELGIGRDITNVMSGVGGAMLVTSLTSTHILYGNNVDDWSLVEINNESGAYAGTAQRFDAPFFWDRQGLRRLDPTNAFGNFTFGSLSKSILPLVQAKGAPAYTFRLQNKDQYRAIFGDRTGISFYLRDTGRGGYYVEAIPFSYGADLAITSLHTYFNGSSNEEITLIGTFDGYVYQLDKGNNFDGEEMSGFVRLAFNNLGSPGRNKLWCGAVVELDAAVNTEIGIAAEFDYGNENTAPAQALVATGGGGFLDEVDWDEFYWSAAYNGRVIGEIEGLGPNCSLAISFASTYQDPHTLQSVRFNYHKRGMVRP